jgi:hypothetical protein
MLFPVDLSLPGSRWELLTGTRRRKREKLQSPKTEY